MILLQPVLQSRASVILVYSPPPLRRVLHRHRSAMNTPIRRFLSNPQHSCRSHGNVVVEGAATASLFEGTGNAWG